MQEVILFYNGLDVPTRQTLDSRGVVPTKTTEDAKKTIQEMAEYSQKWHNGTSRGRSATTLTDTDRDLYKLEMHPVVTESSIRTRASDCAMSDL
ncbi:hypothetical protein Tco_1410741 [Tanacetum coccineum]